MQTKEKTKRARILRKKSTPQEIILWSRLKNRNFRNLKFRRQHPIGKYIVDLVCIEKKIIIELDGWQHKKDTNKKYDDERSSYLQEQDYKVIRFWNNEINYELDSVLMEIERHL